LDFIPSRFAFRSDFISMIHRKRHPRNHVYFGLMTNQLSNHRQLIASLNAAEEICCDYEQNKEAKRWRQTVYYIYQEEM